MVGAGVLPVWKGWVLLGREARDKQWADFGGKRDDTDKSYKDTAAREWEEETMSMWWTQKEMRKQLQKIRPIQLARYQMFVVPFRPRQGMIRQFHNIYKHFYHCRKCPEGMLEKDRVKWVRIGDVLKMNVRPWFRQMFRQWLQERFHM